jgi:hypothetical protein
VLLENVLAQHLQRRCKPGWPRRVCQPAWQGLAEHRFDAPVLGFERGDMVRKKAAARQGKAPNAGPLRFAARPGRRPRRA